MSERWTPGPWSVYQGDEVRGAGNELVVCDHDYEIPDDVAVANACLIAAAPTMAEYIKRRMIAGDAEAAAIWETINARGEPFAHDEAAHAGEGGDAGSS